MRHTNEETDQARVAPLTDCVAPTGTTAEQPSGAVTAAERTEKIRRRLEALINHAVSTREIVADHYATSGRLGHNPSWVKVSDIDAVLGDLPELP